MGYWKYYNTLLHKENYSNSFDRISHFKTLSVEN